MQKQENPRKRYLSCNSKPATPFHIVCNQILSLVRQSLDYGHCYCACFKGGGGNQHKITYIESYSHHAGTEIQTLYTCEEYTGIKTETLVWYTVNKQYHWICVGKFYSPRSGCSEAGGGDTSGITFLGKSIVRYEFVHFDAKREFGISPKVCFPHAVTVDEIVIHMNMMIGHRYREIKIVIVY
jgi:hypothetical protein